jgi:hypothetical protein
MLIFRKVSSVLYFVIVILMISFCAVHPAHAASFTAVQSGNWGDSATWNLGSVPTNLDEVTIPAGITITVSTSVIRDVNTTNNGTLLIPFAIDNRSILLNNGTLTIDSSGLLDNFGTVINASGATLTLTEEAWLDNDGTVTNNGTLIITEASILTTFSSASVINNNLLTITGTGTLNNYGEVDNYASLTNSGALTNFGGGSITNYATLDNPGTLTNNSTLTNVCGGVLTGNPVMGNPAITTPTAPSPDLLAPGHRTHTTDTTPIFSWSTVSGAQSYRLLIHLEDRSFEYKKRVFVPNYTLTSAEALSPAKYLWRVRTQDQTCSTWSQWSTRHTLFIE